MPSQTKAITLDAVKRMNAGTTLWDSRVTGFGVRRQKSEARTYVLKSRVNNQQRWFTIGRHGAPWTPEMARKEAIRILGDIADGLDLAAVREEGKIATTISEMCDQYLVDAEAGKILTKFGIPKKPSTLATDKGRILRHIKPLLGKRLVKDISSQDVKKFLNDLAIGKTSADIKTGKHGRAIVRGGRGTATRTVGLLGGLFTYAIDKGLRPDGSNPVTGVKKFPDKKEMRFLSVSDFAKLGNALATLEVEGINPYGLAGIRLLMLTGCRKSEVLNLKWADVDYENSCLRLPDSKTGSKVILLGAPAIELLSSIPRQKDNNFVLPSTRGNGNFVGLPKVWNQVRKRAGLEWATLHILRHSFASFGAGSGLGLPVIGHLLGHKDSATTARYAKVALDPAKVAADKISEGIASALGTENNSTSKFQIK